MLQNYIYIYNTFREKLIMMFWNFDLYLIWKVFTVEVGKR
jgi:hypothetical protein